MSTMSTMSISRAFSAKKGVRKYEISEPMPQRSLTHRLPQGKHVKMTQISAPVELLSTTNMLSYNAPDIYPRKQSIISSGSTMSSDDTDRSPSQNSTPLTSADNSSIESSSPTEPEPNHLSCFFGAPTPSTTVEVPEVPRRAISHTKKASESMLRKRSMSSISLNNRHRSISASRSSAAILHNAPLETPAEQQHPFGKELAQVSELAEEFGISQEKLSRVDPEEQDLLSRGFFKFKAEDYMNEISDLFNIAFVEERPLKKTMWI